MIHSATVNKICQEFQNGTDSKMHTGRDVDLQLTNGCADLRDNRSLGMKSQHLEINVHKASLHS